MRRLLIALAVLLWFAAPASAYDAGVVRGHVYEDVYDYGVFVGTRPSAGATVVAPADPDICLACRWRGPQRKGRTSVLTDDTGAFRVAFDQGSPAYVWAGQEYGTWFWSADWASPGGEVTLHIPVQAEQAH